MNVGYGMEEDTQMGPLVSASQRECVLGYVQAGLDEGAEVITRPRVLDGGGFFVAPTVMGNARPEMRIAREEIFGPELAAMPFRDLEQAVAMVNDTPDGLAVSVWTRDVGRAHRIAERLRAGRIGINVHAAPDVTMPTGGFRQSGWGRELGPEGLEAYLEVKSVFTKL